MKYLKQFVIGSSYIIFAPFYYAVENSQPKKTYSYYDYTLVAPVWFGIWNIISLKLAEYLKLTMRQRFLLVSILSSLSIMAIATYINNSTLCTGNPLPKYNHTYTASTINQTIQHTIITIYTFRCCVYSIVELDKDILFTLVGS